MLVLPDPNFFGGALTLAGRDGKTAPVKPWDHPFGVENEPGRANYRAAGLAEMARAIVQDRPHRCALDLALHAVDVMTAIQRSGASGRFEALSTRCARPAPLPPDDARVLLA